MTKFILLSLTPIWTLTGFAGLVFGAATLTAAPVVVGVVSLIASYNLVRDVLAGR